jgi:phosphate transport system protein
MRSEHTSTQYDFEFDELGRKLCEFGSTVEEEVAVAIAAIKNISLATQIANKAKADAAAALHRELEYHAILMIARRQPLAVDLREIVGAFKTSQHLDQVRHFAEAIAHHARALDKTRCPRCLLAEFAGLLELVRNHLRATLDAYVARDLNRSAVASVRGKEIAKSSAALVNRVLVLMKSGSDKISVGAPLLICIDDIVGICNQLNRVAETAYFVVEACFPSGDWRVDDAPSIAL